MLLRDKILARYLNLSSFYQDKFLDHQRRAWRKVLRVSAVLRNAREALSSIFISSAAIGALPCMIGHEEKLRWMPVDVVARSTLEIIAHVDSTSPLETINHDGASAWNVINVQEQDGQELTFNSMIHVIQARLKKTFGKECEVVSMEGWIKRVEAFGGRDGKQNPAIKLLEFMGGLAATTPDDGMGKAMETVRTKATSRSLRELGTGQLSWVEFWMHG